jgi:nitrogen PTS system EIIA component
MRISEFLSPADVMVDVRASDKRALLRELARKAASTLKLTEADVSSELLKREELGSTGMGNGVAIPHARIDKVMKPLGLLAKLKQPIDFDAIDGQRVDLVFVLLLPRTAEGSQLGALASVARKLRTAEALAQLRRAESAAELYAAIAA